MLVAGVFFFAILFGIYAWNKNDHVILSEISTSEISTSEISTSEISTSEISTSENIVNNADTASEINNENYRQNEDTTILLAFPTSETQQDFTFITDYSSEDFADITDSYSIFTDPMFSDIIKYMSTISDNNKVVESGVEKCLKNCEGNCIEYGFTGVGICFPSSWTPPTTEESAPYYDMT